MKKTKFILPLIFITPALASVPMLLQTSCSENKEEEALEISFDDIPANCIVESGTPVYYKHGNSIPDANPLLDLRAYAEYKEYEGSHFSIAKDETLSLGLLIGFDQNVTLVSGTFDINDATANSVNGIIVGSTTDPVEGTKYSGHLTIGQNVYFSINATNSANGITIIGNCSSEASVVNHGVFNISSVEGDALGILIDGDSNITSGCNFENTGILSIKESSEGGLAVGVHLGETHQRKIKITGYIGVDCADGTAYGVTTDDLDGSDVQLGAICETNATDAIAYALGRICQKEGTKHVTNITYNGIAAINASEMAVAIDFKAGIDNSKCTINLAGDTLISGDITSTIANYGGDGRWGENSILKGEPKFYSSKNESGSSWTKLTINNGAHQKYYYNNDLIKSTSPNTGKGDTTLEQTKLQPQDNPLFVYTLQSGAGKDNYNSAIHKALNNYKGKLSNDCIGKGWIQGLLNSF